MERTTLLYYSGLLEYAITLHLSIAAVMEYTITLHHFIQLFMEYIIHNTTPFHYIINIQFVKERPWLPSSSPAVIDSTTPTHA